MLSILYDLLGNFNESTPGMWIQIQSDPFPGSGSVSMMWIQVANNQPKSWETDIKSHQKLPKDHF